MVKPGAVHLLFALLVALAVAPVGVQAEQERKLYRDAIAKLRAGNDTGFRQLQARLSNYILHPYLEYHGLNSRLSSSSNRQVMTFLNQHADIPAHRHLKRRWLKKLGRQRNWQLLLANYDGPSDAELNCYYLRALYGTGQQQQALAQTAEAWTKAASQPKACDPLFDVWQKSEHFNDTIIWNRLQLALAANQVTLARYLVKQFSQLKGPAQLFYDAHVRPQRILSNRAYHNDTRHVREIVAHTLPRLARKDPARASSAWADLQKSLDFNEQETRHIQQQLVLVLAREGQFPPINKRALINDSATIQTLVQLAAQHEAWGEVIYWAETLPADEQQKPEVQYWLARALAISTGDLERARLAFNALAKTRHYYGFWAAHSLGVPGQLNANPVYDQRVTTSQLATRPRIARSLELFAVGDELNGRREWYAALDELTIHEQKVAAELALGNGLLPLTIRTANHAKARNSLHLRFPVAYLPQFRRASLDTGLATPSLLAITRQESAWDHQAISSAKAYGLMQLLPSTARLVARRFRLSAPSTKTLHDPGTNIGLGSRHLAWLLDRYDGQFVPAIAAYNAGEHRVDRWLKERPDMPLDVWIETIPFRETRNYVKNVLAFRHVYGQLTNAPLAFINQDELVVSAP